MYTPPLLYSIRLGCEAYAAQTSRSRVYLGVFDLILPGERQVLLAERTYRDGTHILLDPSPEEVETARSGHLWEVWNSKRSQYLYSASGPKGGLFEEDEIFEEPSARG